MKDINTLTTVPFLKNVNLDLSYLYIPAVVFIVTATSNAVNLTDGLDGLAIGLIAIVMIALAILSYISGNAIFSNYLNIIYLPGSGELTVFVAALGWGITWIFMVQLLPRTGIYGRYRFACSWWSLRNFGCADKKRIVDSYPGRRIFYGNNFSNHSKGLLQVYKEKIWRGKKSF